MNKLQEALLDEGFHGRGALVGSRAILNFSVEQGDQLRISTLYHQGSISHIAYYAPWDLLLTPPVA